MGLSMPCSPELLDTNCSALPCCSVMGLAGYLALPGGMDSNIMNSYPPDYQLMQVGWAGLLAGLRLGGSQPCSRCRTR